MRLPWREHLALLGLGLVLAALLASSLIAMKFHWAPELGEPVYGIFYHPLDAWRWWSWWSDDAASRVVFRNSLTNIVVVAMAPLLIAAMRQRASGLQPERRDPDLGLGTVKELLASAKVKTRGPGFVVGLKGTGPISRRRVLRHHGKGHGLLMGRTDGGKDVGFLLPTVLDPDNDKDSMLVFDPKHEMERITARHRRSLGPIFNFDPTSPVTSCFNPILELRLGNALIGDAQALGRVMAPQQGKDAVWDKAAADLVAGAAAHVRESSDPTLAHVYRVLRDVQRQLPVRTTSQFVDDIFAGHASLNEKTRTSVEFNVFNHLAFLADPNIQAATAASDFRAADLMTGPDPITAYLSSPVADGERLEPLMRGVLEMLSKPLLRELNCTQDGVAKERGCTVIANEFYQLGKMWFFSKGLPIIRGFGFRVLMVCQDLNQIEEVYGQYQSVTGNCELIAVIPGFSDRALKTLVSFAGDQIVASQGRSSQGIGLKALLPNASESEQRQPVLNARDMLLRSKDEVLIFTVGTGVPPTWLHRLRYYDHPRYKGRFDAV